MKLTEEMITIINKAPYLTLVTVSKEGIAHPVIVGGKEVSEDAVHIGIYKLSITQENLSNSSKAWLAVATVENGPKGFRFEGTASVCDKKIVFTPDTAEPMI